MNGKFGLSKRSEADKFIVDGSEVLRRMTAPEYLPNYIISRMLKRSRESLPGYLNSLKEYAEVPPNAIPTISYYSGFTEREYLFIYRIYLFITAII